VSTDRDERSRDDMKRATPVDDTQWHWRYTGRGWGALKHQRAHRHAGVARGDPATVSDQRLFSPPLAIPPRRAGQPDYGRSISMEAVAVRSVRDGGLLEISTTTACTWTQSQPVLLIHPYECPPR
jgi:hypothetical protein